LSAGQDHRRVEEGIEPAHALQIRIAHHAAEQRQADDQRCDRKTGYQAVREAAA
jgi:hypothetical protein